MKKDLKERLRTMKVGKFKVSLSDHKKSSVCTEVSNASFWLKPKKFTSNTKGLENEIEVIRIK